MNEDNQQFTFENLGSNEFDFNFQQKYDFNYLQSIIDDSEMELKKKVPKIKEFDFIQMIQSPTFENELVEFLERNM